MDRVASEWRRIDDRTVVVTSNFRDRMSSLARRLKRKDLDGRH